MTVTQHRSFLYTVQSHHIPYGDMQDYRVTIWPSTLTPSNYPQLVDGATRPALSLIWTLTDLDKFPSDRSDPARLISIPRREVF